MGKKKPFGIRLLSGFGLLFGFISLFGILLQFIGVFLFGFGIVCIILSVGLYQLRRWARITWCVVWGALVSLILFITYSIVTDVLNQRGSNAIKDVLFWVTFSFPIMIFGVASLVYVNLPGVRILFNNERRTSVPGTQGQA